MELRIIASTAVWGLAADNLNPHPGGANDHTITDRFPNPYSNPIFHTNTNVNQDAHAIGNIFSLTDRYANAGGTVLLWEKSIGRQSARLYRCPFVDDQSEQ
jgi:hypothetical protein